METVKQFEKYKGNETDFQKTVARTLNLMGVLWTHPANERKTTVKRGKNGKLYSPEGSKLKQMGVKKGVPDILIFDKIKEFSGFAIELKAGSNKASEHQLEWLSELEKRGWKTLVTNSLDEVLHCINEYFKK